MAQLAIFRGRRAFEQLVADDGSHFRVGLELKFFPPAPRTETCQTDSLLLNGGKISLKCTRRNMEICIDFNWKIARSRLME